MRERDYYDYDEEELRRRHIAELKRKRRLKRKIKKYARFFGAWALVIGLAVLLIVGVVKLAGAIIGAFSGDGEATEITEVHNTDKREQADLSTGEAEADDENSRTSSGGYEKPSYKGLVIIDAGHGGYDGGTSNGDVCEKDVNLDIAYWTKEALELKGYEVYMTRTDDSFVGLSKRATLANEHPEAICFVSIHQNSIDGHSEIRGVEGWTHQREGCEELAAALSAEVSKATGAQDRGVAFRTALVVCRDTKMPAAIVECGYMSNKEECDNLGSTDYQTKIANGIVNGIESFVAEREKASKQQ